MDGRSKNDISHSYQRGYRASNPQISDPNSPLDALAMSALRRYGDFHPGTIDGDVIMMMLEFANLIVTDIQTHPYWPTGKKIDFYIHSSDHRCIPDAIVVAGLVAHYASQQGSEKFQFYLANYYKVLNSTLWSKLNDSSGESANVRPNMRTVDDHRPVSQLNGVSDQEMEASKWAEDSATPGIAGLTE